MLAFIERASLKGTESETHAYLKQKLKLEIEKKDVPEVPPPETTTEVEPVLSPIQEEDLKPADDANPEAVN